MKRTEIRVMRNDGLDPLLIRQQSHGIRRYTGIVRLRGLRSNQGFETHLRGFCLCRRGF